MAEHTRQKMLDLLFLLPEDSYYIFTNKSDRSVILEYVEFTEFREPKQYMLIHANKLWKQFSGKMNPPGVFTVERDTDIFPSKL